jgi:hypothetical protein
MQHHGDSTPHAVLPSTVAIGKNPGISTIQAKATELKKSDLVNCFSTIAPVHACQIDAFMYVIDCSFAIGVARMILWKVVLIILHVVCIICNAK